MATGDESKETIILADADDNKSKDVVAEAKPNANPPPNHESTSTANVGAAMINDSIQSVVSKQPTATISTVAASDTVPVRRKLIAGKTLLMRRPWKLNMSNGAVNGAIGAINQAPQVGKLPPGTNAPYPVEYSNNNKYCNEYIHNYYMQQQQQAIAYQRGQQQYAQHTTIPGAGGIVNSSKGTKHTKITSKVPAKAKSKSSPKIKNPEIFSGEPVDALEGGWPHGWIKKTVKRMGGQSAGTCDSYCKCSTMALYYFYISHTDILVLNLTHNIRSHRDISKNEL
jgi:hypothetical protein